MYFVRRKNFFITLGLLILAASIGFIAIFGLRLGIDFTGGALMEVTYSERPEKAIVEEELRTLELGEFSLRQTTTEGGREGFVLRARDLTDEERTEVEAILTADHEARDARVERFTSIGPVIGQELRDKAVWAIGGVVLIIVLYVAFAFAGVGRPVGSWIYGGITIFALAHDVLVPTALVAVLGVAAGVEIDVLFVMAILAVLGYSVNDTIVVFDRVRENLVKYRQEKKVTEKDQFNQPIERIEHVFTKPFSEIVGEALEQTIARSINTSLTTLIAVAALYVFGGSVTQTFALVLIAGIIAGTYSSIFLASPLLVWVAERQERRSK